MKLMDKQQQQNQYFKIFHEEIKLFLQKCVRHIIIKKYGGN